jgi:SAM-dependent methyltransferase
VHSAHEIEAKAMNRAAELQSIYSQRFEGRQAYRNRVWHVLAQRFFGRFIPSDATVLDLGCGYGEFINNVDCGAKFGMDLNPASRRLLGEEVTFFEQDCSATWPLDEGSLDVVFSSNFFEHLTGKDVLGETLDQARRCLRPGGKLIAMGPNIKYVPGEYWDFWDHHLPLTELSLSEGLRNRGFEITACWPRFLPYTMVGGPEYPPILLRIYLGLPVLWPMFGRQFLVIGEKRSG